MIIDGEKSLDDFLLSSPPKVDDNILNYCGLKSDSGFNLVEHLHQSLKIYSQEHEKSKLSTL